jgi:hypothetical protein
MTPVSDDFSQPLRGDKFEAEQFDGALLLFYPIEYFTSIPTQHGETAVVDTHIVALDRPDLTGQPTVLRDARIFGRALVPQLKGAVGAKPVLGRLGRGQNTKGNPPWLLKDFTEQDAALARQYASSHPDPRTPVSAPPTSSVSAPTVTAGSNVGPTPAPPTATAAAAPARDPQLLAQLIARGVDVSKLPADADLSLILNALG